MSMQNTNDDQPLDDDGASGADEYGSLTVEDDPEGTVDPSELAGTATEDDQDVS